MSLPESSIYAKIIEINKEEAYEAISNYKALGKKGISKIMMMPDKSFIKKLYLIQEKEEAEKEKETDKLLLNNTLQILSSHGRWNNGK